MKLYNLDELAELCGQEKCELKGKDFYRADIIYQCETCHTKTNKIEMDYRGGMGTPRKILWPTLPCPGLSYFEHDNLEDAIEKYGDKERDFRKFIEFKKKSKNPKDTQRIIQFIEDLGEQKDMYRIRIDMHREVVFSEKLDDIEGVDVKTTPIYYFCPYDKFGPSSFSYSLIEMFKKHLINTNGENEK